jgi:hypothetical protein
MTKVTLADQLAEVDRGGYTVGYLSPHNEPPEVYPSDEGDGREGMPAGRVDRTLTADQRQRVRRCTTRST